MIWIVDGFEVKVLKKGLIITKAKQVKSKKQNEKAILPVNTNFEQWL